MVPGAGSADVNYSRAKRQKKHKLLSQPPPPNLITSRRIPARSSSVRIPFLSGQPSGIRQRKRAVSSPLTSSTVLILGSWSQGLSALYGVHASAAVKTSVRGLLPANPKSGRPRRDQVSNINRKYPNLDVVRQDLEFRLENAREYSVKDGPIWGDAKHLNVCLRRKSAVYATQLTSFINKEYARLAGDSPVETIAADAENDGGPGSGDEGGKKTSNLSRLLKSRLQKLIAKADDECVSFHIFIG